MKRKNLTLERTTKIKNNFIGRLGSLSRKPTVTPTKSDIS